MGGSNTKWGELNKIAHTPEEMDGSITVLGRLEGQTIFDRTEIRLPPEGVDQTAMLRLAEQGFGLPKGSVTAVLWDDDTDRGLLIRRDKEFSRLRDGDELCFRWNLRSGWTSRISLGL